MKRLPLAFAAAILSAAPAWAEPPGADAGRYQMQAVEGGIARLDTATGEVSFCRVEGRAIACEGGSAGRTATQRQLDALAARVERLEAGAGDGTERMEDATEEMRLFFRTFRDIIREMDEAFGEEEAAPGKTSIRG